MKVTVAASVPEGRLEAVPSKSHLHRILVAAALADAPCKILCSATSDDVDATVRCLNALGADVSRVEDGFAVTPVTAVGKGATLDCGESGTTLRFMLPISCALGADATLTGKGRLPLRPIGALTDTLARGGVSLSSDKLPLSLSGRLTAGEHTVDGSVSSQYVSGLLLALGALKGESVLVTEGAAVSRGYIDMTLDVMNSFGVKTVRDGNRYLVKSDGYRSPREIAAEGDWSGAAFPLAAGILAGDVTVTGLNPDSAQRDKKIVELIRLMGGDIRTAADGVRTVKSALHAVTADLTDVPDLAPVLSVLMAAAEGKSVMTGVGRLRDKESDRLRAVAENLAAMGVKTQVGEDSLAIYGGKIESGFRALGYGDHRMVMSATVAALATGGEVTDGECVSKSYPSFFRDMVKLGGKINESV